MNLAALHAAVTHAEASLPTEDIPEALGLLEAARARFLRRMVEAAAQPRKVSLITAVEAAAIARMPRRRLYSLSRGAPWAVRVGRKLLIEETGFRLALDMRSHVRGEHETARATAPGSSGPSFARIRARQSHRPALATAAKMRP